MNRLTIGALGFETFFGFLTFTGTLMAFGKLQGFISGAPITFPGLNAINIVAFFGSLVGLVFVVFPSSAPQWMFYAMCGVGLVIGVTAVIPIGGADMPVVISLLNSYAGLSASATGFALKQQRAHHRRRARRHDRLLLSMMMSKAMNRSFANVLFGAFGTGEGTAAPTADGSGKAVQPGDDRGRRRTCSRRRSRSSSCRATAWPSHRRSTPCAISRRRSRSAAPRSSTRSTRSPGACPVT